MQRLYYLCFTPYLDPWTGIRREMLDPEDRTTIQQSLAAAMSDLLAWALELYQQKHLDNTPPQAEEDRTPNSLTEAIDSDTTDQSEGDSLIIP